MNKIVERDAEAVGAAMNPQGHIVFTMYELELYTARCVSDAHDLIVEGGHTNLVDVLQQWGINYEP
jgi:hypothetical protein